MIQLPSFSELDISSAFEYNFSQVTVLLLESDQYSLHLWLSKCLLGRYGGVELNCMFREVIWLCSEHHLPLLT